MIDPAENVEQVTCPQCLGEVDIELPLKNRDAYKCQQCGSVISYWEEADDDGQDGGWEVSK